MVTTNNLGFSINIGDEFIEIQIKGWHFTGDIEIDNVEKLRTISESLKINMVIYH